MRYVIALIAAALIIGGGMLFVHQTWQSLYQTIRHARLREQQAGTLPPELQGVNIQSAEIEVLLGGDVSMSLPAAMHQRLKLAMLLSEFWYIGGPLVVACCLGAAFLIGVVMKPEK